MKIIALKEGEAQLEDGDLVSQELNLVQYDGCAYFMDPRLENLKGNQVTIRYFTTLDDETLPKTQWAEYKKL